MTHTGQVLAQLAANAWLPMKSYGDGLIAGALFINPDGKATVTYHNKVGFDETSTDPVRGAAAANPLVDSGADILFGVGGRTGSNLLEAATARGADSIGAEVDQFNLLPEAAARILTSGLKIITPAMAGLLMVAKESQAKTVVFPRVIILVRSGLFHILKSFSRPGWCQTIDVYTASSFADR